MEGMLVGKLKSVSQREYKRYQIAILNKNGVSSGIISWFLNSDIITVRRWISRLDMGSEMCINDKKRSGRPLSLTEVIQMKVIAFYCQTPPPPGCTRWSLSYADKYLKTHPNIIGCSISRSSIHRVLRSHSLKPHLFKYFLHITDPDFFIKMEHIINIYLNPPDNLFCFDECPGIQALERLAPDLPTEERQKWLREFEYGRNGTLDLMAFLDPRTGKISGKCTPDHKTETFISVFKEHVNMLPADAQIHYIMDNLSPHFNDEFCKTVAKLSHVSYTTLKTGKERREWLMSNNKRIVIHFTPFHGSWLNMVEIWFGILNRKCLSGSFVAVSSLDSAIYDFIETWNEYFAHPFTWKYTGEGLQQKAVARFVKFLNFSFEQMNIKFLTKQLQLMTNIAKLYWKKVEIKHWKNLFNSVLEKENLIRSKIQSEEKPKRKAKAENALQDFFHLLSNIWDNHQIYSLQVPGNDKLPI
jgi:transposase